MLAGADPGPIAEDVAAPPDRLDLRLLPAVVTAWAMAWATPVLGEAVALVCSALAVLACAGFLAAGRRLPPRRRTVALVLAAAFGVGAAAGLAATARVAALGAGPLPDLAAAQATARLDVRVVGDPVVRITPGRWGQSSIVVVPVRVSRVVARGVTTAVRSPVTLLASEQSWARMIPGQKLTVAGRLAPARPRTPAVAVLRVPGHPEAARAAPAPDRAAAEVRAGLRRSVGGLPDGPRALVPALVLGDTSGLDPDLAADFRTAGLSHVLVVSGANVAILLAAVLALARAAGVRLRALPVLGVATIAAFLLVARPEPSLLRASVMGLIAVTGLALGRRSRGVPALCAAVIVLILGDPWLAHAPGFALSVSATAGLLVLAPRWRERLTRRMRPALATALAVPLAAQAACLPVLVLFAGEISLVAVLANVLAVPAVPPAMILGVLAAGAAQLAPPLGAMFAELAGIPAWWIVVVARTSAQIPGATLPWPVGLRGLAAVLAVAALLVAVARARERPRRTPLAIAGLAGLLVVLLLWRPPIPAPLRGVLAGTWPPSGWTLAACDVGQGDALVLRAGPRSAVVVDAGPDPSAVDRCLRRLGVRHVPYLMLSHFHADHVDGLSGVLRGRRVDEIGVAALTEPPGQAEMVRRLADDAGISLTVPAAGEVRSVGDLRWRVLWPRRLIESGSAANNASIAALVEMPGGIRVLLTGDIEPPAQAALLRAEPGLRAEILKVPHHGSRFQDPALLAGLGAGLAIVSAGADNDYGHPAPVTLELLERAGMAVLRTDLQGSVAITIRDDGLEVRAERRRNQRLRAPRGMLTPCPPRSDPRR
ncbi:MAG: ComEC/Rec2 family competence protein [Sporichthyaceae bacterium]